MRLEMQTGEYRDWKMSRLEMQTEELDWKYTDWKQRLEMQTENLNRK